MSETYRGTRITDEFSYGADVIYPERGRIAKAHDQLGGRMPYRDCRAAGHRKYQRDGQWFCRDCSVLEQQGQAGTAVAAVA